MTETNTIDIQKMFTPTVEQEKELEQFTFITMVAFDELLGDIETKCHEIGGEYLSPGMLKRIKDLMLFRLNQMGH